MTPDYEITVGGQAITPQISGRFINLTIRDKRGFEADELTLTLDDADGRMGFPGRGATVAVSIGFDGQGLHDKGTFIVDELSHTGPADKIILRARSADFHKSLNEQKMRSFRDVPLGDILRTIAGDHGLEVSIAERLAWQNPGHIDQTGESDGHLLTRLGRQYDAVATVKAGRLLFTPMAQGATASGLSLPVATISRQDGDTHNYKNLEGTSDYTGVKAYWYDPDAAQHVEVVIEGESETRKLKTLQQTYPSADDATNAANSEWQRIQRGRDTMSLTLAVGRPELIPETPVTLVGWPDPITAKPWICGAVDHSLNTQGLTTAVKLETIA